MAATRIKICGVTTPDAIEAAIAGRADYIGLNFFPPSPRYLDAGKATGLARQAKGRSGLVGVFVDPGQAELAELVAAGALDAVQLHGGEDPARVAAIRAQLGLPAWKVLSIASRDDLAKAEAFVGAADFLLLDAKTPKGTLPGGMGLRFDWSILAGWKAPLPWGLAGGLTPSNVAEAIAATGASLVDTASGVESATGVKDPALIAAFCAAAKAA